MGQKGLDKVLSISSELEDGMQQQLANRSFLFLFTSDAGRIIFCLITLRKGKEKQAVQAKDWNTRLLAAGPTQTHLT